MAEVVALAIGVLGLGSLIFTALRYRRDDTTAILGQQDTILTEMRGLNDELRHALADCRERHERRA